MAILVRVGVAITRMGSALGWAGEATVCEECILWPGMTRIDWPGDAVDRIRWPGSMS